MSLVIASSSPITIILKNANTLLWFAKYLMLPFVLAVMLNISLRIWVFIDQLAAVVNLIV